MSATMSTVGDHVRRVVNSLLRDGCQGKVLCSRCLVKLTRDHMDERYPTREIAQMIADVFGAPGSITHARVSTCAACAGNTMPCLGIPLL
jgi:ferredoxin